MKRIRRPRLVLRQQGSPRNTASLVDTTQGQPLSRKQFQPRKRKGVRRTPKTNKIPKDPTCICHAAVDVTGLPSAIRLCFSGPHRLPKHCPQICSSPILRIPELGLSRPAIASGHKRYKQTTRKPLSPPRGVAITDAAPEPYGVGESNAVSHAHTKPKCELCEMEAIVGKGSRGRGKAWMRVSALWSTECGAGNEDLSPGMQASREPGGPAPRPRAPLPSPPCPR
ncbi:uncharacterized protein VTP21DRAFT_6642 [Calcarisporiella thermophila]|uniref:uncharacterized protein n=1 Tax=Calcarisporiella thermophila TaxID=911321 RepID=UPI003743C0A3